MKKRTKILPNVGVAQQPRNLALSTNEPRGAYFFDPDSEKQRASAIAYADVVHVFQQPTKYWPNGCWTTTHAAATPTGPTGYAPIVRPNKPMTGLVLLNLETRLEGGRAYKVTNPADNTLFDIREDQMLQAILKHGIQAGGVIGGEWVWAMNHTQIKCYLTDSDEYKAMINEHGLASHPTR